ncbi:hypothetical protein FF124_00065 [Martelella lutilitoris]|uniref:Cyclic di-GMP-binding protein n=1 Tax=Martelella lutilitoris TaxID=2583532 RepID=A0A5C4JVS9_9HYPH|nr:hypothetical protein [Martelella lutilitoris]TNB49402.1 hypothetical protein FF124_00065 [Martelella lutilitoris]
MTVRKNSAGRKATLCVAIGSLLLLSGQTTTEAGDVADAIRALGESDVVTRKVSLTDLGITEPLAFSANRVNREIFIPVPAGVPLIEPKLFFDGTHLRGDGGKTTYILSLDGYAVAARSPEGERGKTQFDIGVDGSAREDGFVRLGIAWQPLVGQFYCYGTGPNSNRLLVHPDTYLEYSYNAADLKTVSSAFAAFKQTVTLLVAGNVLDSDSYDAAWRLGVALQRAGKTLQLRALPARGDTVDASAITVPAALASVPGFAAFSKGGLVEIDAPAQIGALLVLGATDMQADIAIAGTSLSAEIDAALKAIGAELSSADPDAAEAFKALVAARETLSLPVEAGSYSVRLVGGEPVLAVQPDGAREAAGLFSTWWRRTATSGDMVIRAARLPMADGDAMALLPPGDSDSNFSVVGLGEWSTTADLGGDIPPGMVPSVIHVFVSAAPGATATRPVASVFLNDMLLGAKQLEADGMPEAISVPVPAYTLLPSNTIVVRVQRQPAPGDCQELPQGYPVSISPDSYVELAPAPEAVDFSSVSARLAGDSLVVVNKSWLEDALTTLPNVIVLADASGIAPERADFSVADRATYPEPDKPFLLFDVAVEGVRKRASVDGNTVQITTAKGTTLFDATGLSDIALLQAETGGDEPGLTYSADGVGPLIEKPLRLRHGDVAVIGSEGVLAEVRTSGRPLPSNTEPDRLTKKPFSFSWRLLTDTDFWFRQLPVLMTALILGGFVLLMLLARLAKRRKRDGKS